MRSMLLPFKMWVDSWYYVLLKTQHFKRTVCLSLQNIPYILLLQGALSGRCSTAWGQNEISCQSKMLLSFVDACYKGMQHRSKHHPIVWAWRNRSKLNSILSLILIVPIQYFVGNWLFLAVWRLLLGPPSLFLPDLQTWICTVAKLTGKATGRNWMEAVASTKEKQENIKSKKKTTKNTLKPKKTIKQ